MTYLVMGATGNVGAQVVEQLTAQGKAVRAVSRTARSWPPGVEGYVGDPNRPGGLDDALDGVRGVFLMCGYAAEPSLLAKLRDAHVVVLSASSAELGDLGNPMAAMHLSTEQAVGDSGLRWTFVRSCSMQSNLLRWRDQLLAGDVIRAPFADVPVAMINPGDVAAVAALALTEAGHEEAIHRVSGPESLTPAQQTEVLASVLHRDLAFEAMPDEQVTESMGEKYGAAAIEVFRQHPELESDVQPTVATLLGRPAGDLRDWVTTHRERFN